MSSRVLFLVHAVFLGASMVHAQPAMGTLRLVIYGPAGTVVNANDLIVEVRDAKTGNNHAKRINGGIVQIPYGSYHIAVWAGGFREYKTEVEIVRPITTLRAELELGVFDGETSYNEISGRVEGMRDGKDLWVKLFPLLRDDFPSAADDVSRDGVFVVGGVRPGQYVICLMRGPEVVFASRIVVIGRAEVVLMVDDGGRVRMTRTDQGGRSP